MIALLLSILGRCPEVKTFLENDPRDLSDADIAIASLKLIPLYWDRCPSMRRDLNFYNKRLTDENARRLRRERAIGVQSLT